MMMDVDGDEPRLTKAFACTPIYDSLFSFLPLHALVQLALTCHAAYLAVTDYKTRAFNINRHLSRYFSDPIAFRSLQAKTNTLISGSNALQFLDRSFYPESDLDLYTHPGHSFEVAQFLVEAEGYTFVPSDRQEQRWKESIPSHWDGTQGRVRKNPVSQRVYPLVGISHTFTFEKTGLLERETLKIQIIETAASPVEAILGFHCTCVMNLISSDAAYALYPLATLVKRAGFGMPNGTRAHAALTKYIQRGWRIYFTARPEDLKNPLAPPFVLNGRRWVGDKYTWVIPLDQTGVQPRPPLSPQSQPLAFDPVLCYGWELQPKLDLTSRSHYECKTYTVQSTLFRYNYAFPDEKLANTVINWAGGQGKYSHLYVNKEDWVWFDGDIPGFLRTECDREVES